MFKNYSQKRRLNRRLSNREATGSTLLELGPTLWVLLLLLFFPLLDLATIGFRYTFLLGASRDAARAASIANTFQTDINPLTNPSAINAARNRAALNAGSWKGLRLVSTTTSILQTNLQTRAITKITTPLIGPVDTTNFMYQYQVDVVGDVDPLVPYRGAVLGNITGLTKAARFTVSSIELCENPEGLNQ